MAKLKTLGPRVAMQPARTQVLTPGSWRTEGMTSTQRGYGYRWQKAREEYLRAHPLCECDECQGGKLRVKIATVVDHRQPHRGDQTLFWDRSNWCAMSKACHDAKTAREDGGFGNG